MRRVDAHQLEQASSQLGDVVLDPAVWPQVMEEICRAAGATGAGLLQSDRRTPDVPVTAGVKEVFDNYFRHGWHERDLRIRGVPLLLGGEPVITDQDLVTPQEMRTEPYYNDMLAPFGFQWFAGVGFWSGPFLWGLTIQRTCREGPFDDGDKRILATLSRKLTEVATLSMAVGRTVLSSATNALSALRQPAIAVDRLGCVLDANPASDEVFCDDVHVRNGRLFVVDRQSRSRVEKLMDRIRITPDTAALPCDPIVIRRAGGRL